MAGKQVISHAFGPHSKGSSKRRALAHQRALVGGMRWHLKDVLEALLVLLQLSILLFFAGITLYLGNRSHAIAIATLAPGCAGTLGYIILFQFTTASFNPTGPWLLKGLRFGTRFVATVFSLWEYSSKIGYVRLRKIVNLTIYCAITIVLVLGVVVLMIIATKAVSFSRSILPVLFALLSFTFIVLIVLLFIRVMPCTPEPAPIQACSRVP